MANLQLLEGHLNVLKSDCLPAAWLQQTYPDPKQRKAVIDRYDIGEPPTTVLEFAAFYKARREQIKKRLTALLTPTQEASKGVTNNIVAA